jgi:hypothetical protein
MLHDLPKLCVDEAGHKLKGTPLIAKCIELARCSATQPLLEPSLGRMRRPSTFHPALQEEVRVSDSLKVFNMYRLF